MGKALLGKNVSKCAFCKYWYDPANSAIEPAQGKGMWYIIDTGMKKKCLKNNLSMQAGAFCGKFESKL